MALRHRRLLRHDALLTAPPNVGDAFSLAAAAASALSSFGSDASSARFGGADAATLTSRSASLGRRRPAFFDVDRLPSVLATSRTTGRGCSTSREC